MAGATRDKSRDTGRPPARGLGRQDWIATAAQALAEAGVAAVAVEPVAKRLGVSKGSFYWHFANRDELLEATLAAWLEITEEIIRRAEALPGPRARLEAVFDATFADPLWPSTEVDLHAHIHVPQVAKAVNQATSRRLGFMAQCLRDLGLSAHDARDGALQAYALWTGLLHVRVATPGVVPTGTDGDHFAASTLALLQTIYDRATPSRQAAAREIT